MGTPRKLLILFLTTMTPKKNKKLLRISTPTGLQAPKTMTIFTIEGVTKTDGTIFAKINPYGMRETLGKMGITTLEEFINLFEYEQGVQKPAVYVNAGDDFDDINLLAQPYKKRAEPVSKPVLTKQQSEQVFADISMDDLPF